MDGILALRPTRPADRRVEGKRVQPAQKVGQGRHLVPAVGGFGALDETGDKDRAPLEVRHRVVDRETFGGKIPPFEITQDGGVTLDAGPRPSGRKGTSNPG